MKQGGYYDVRLRAIGVLSITSNRWEIEDTPKIIVQFLLYLAFHELYINDLKNFDRYQKKQ